MAAVSLAGCAAWRPVSVPIATIVEPARCRTPADTLLVMLPGAGSTPEEFIVEGFVRAVRKRQLAADIVLVDAHRGYYDNDSIVGRLRADVIDTARARGYAQIWLVGISLGALGGMMVGDQHPAGITGIVAIGPYLGSRAKGAEIAAAGGLRAWAAPAGALAPDDFDNRLWRSLQPYAAAPAARRAGEARPTLLLGYGRSDRFSTNQDLLAAALPATQVFTADGGHDWAPWLSVWERMLPVMAIRADASCVGREAA